MITLIVGLISLNEWCITIEKATELKLPWRLLRPRVAELDLPTGLVKYHSTFTTDTTSTQVRKKVGKILNRYIINFYGFERNFFRSLVRVLFCFVCISGESLIIKIFMMKIFVIVKYSDPLHWKRFTNLNANLSHFQCSSG